MKNTCILVCAVSKGGCGYTWDWDRSWGHINQTPEEELVSHTMQQRYKIPYGAPASGCIRCAKIAWDITEDPQFRQKVPEVYIKSWNLLMWRELLGTFGESPIITE